MAGVRIGDAGGIRIAPEAPYGTPGTYVDQNARTGPLGHKRALLPAARLGVGQPTVRKYGVPSNDGEIGLAYDNSRAVIGDLLGHAGVLSTDVYAIGDGATPDINSLSIWVDYGGYVILYDGCKIQSLKLDIQPNAPVVISAAFLSQGQSEPTPEAITPPSETGIVWESDISTVTLGGVANCVLTGTIDVAFQLVGSDRHCLGAGLIKEPVYTGRPVITASLNAELSDDVGADSQAILSNYLSGTALGDIVLGDFELSNCYMVGDSPTLGEGITQQPINVESNLLSITTAA